MIRLTDVPEGYGKKPPTPFTMVDFHLFTQYCASIERRNSIREPVMIAGMEIRAGALVLNVELAVTMVLDLARRIEMDALDPLDFYVEFTLTSPNGGFDTELRASAFERPSVRVGRWGEGWALLDAPLRTLRSYRSSRLVDTP